MPLCCWRSDLWETCQPRCVTLGTRPRHIGGDSLVRAGVTLKIFTGKAKANDLAVPEFTEKAHYQWIRFHISGNVNNALHVGSYFFIRRASFKWWTRVLQTPHAITIIECKKKKKIKNKTDEFTTVSFLAMVLFKINVSRNITTDEKVLTCYNHGHIILLFGKSRI